MSAVTAVPLRPIARGSVLKLWIGLALLSLVALGVAWWGTRWMQPVTLDSGVRVQTVREGSGPPVASTDVVALRFQIHVNSLDGPAIGDSGAQPFVGTMQELPAWLGESVQSMREGGRYLLMVPVRNVLNGQPVPPTARFTASDTLAVETQILQIDRGQASAYQMQRMQQMMQQQQMQGANPHEGTGVPPPGSGAAPPAPAGR
jgi:FKBP-type peptidyl-prolyl cis-trans isomerase FkpA